MLHFPVPPKKPRVAFDVGILLVFGSRNVFGSQCLIPSGRGSKRGFPFHLEKKVCFISQPVDSGNPFFAFGVGMLLVFGSSYLLRMAFAGAKRGLSSSLDGAIVLWGPVLLNIWMCLCNFYTCPDSSCKAKWHTLGRFIAAVAATQPPESCHSFQQLNDVLV